MGGLLSAPAKPTPQAPVKARPVRASRPAPPPREAQKIDRQFIPDDIDDPKPGEPCGLYVEGVQYHWTGDKFIKILKENNINFEKALKKKSSYCAKIYFENNDDRRNAYKILSKTTIRNKLFFVVPLQKDMKKTAEQATRLRARATSDLSTRDINARLTPWYKIPYDEQIRMKSEKYTKKISTLVQPRSDPIEVFPTPRQSAYRNKVEVTFGKDLNGEICLGFNLGSRMEDVIVPVPEDCFNSPAIAPALSRHLAQFIQTTKYPVYDRIDGKGTWKFATIRSTETGQTMLAICTFKEINEETQNAIIQEFKDEVTSLYWIETTSSESFGPNPISHLLSGPEFIVERLRGLDFDISPLSFFQTNTAGAEILFDKIENLAQVDKKTILVDVCCGTGVIGLSMAKKVKKVIGIDIEEQAILDAQRNAKKNKIKNAEFIAGKAEEHLTTILSKYSGENNKIICIVDPPRGGLHKKALWALRDCELVKRLVYVSCNPDSLVSDSNNVLFAHARDTMPFQPEKWLGVDMFPHTERIELVMLMRR